MSFRFCVLGSGSSGNASYLEAGGFGLLLDIGLGPRRLARGLADAGAGWDKVRAVLLTHTHGDHWQESTLRHLLRCRILLYCHGHHLENLHRLSPTFGELAAAGLVRNYAADEPLEIGPLRGLPFIVPHDDVPTCAFRIESEGGAHALGYAADLGSWTERIARALCDVDVLAVEFNHDIDMERGSGRAPMLIDRVLGDHGHLSNDQGAELVAEALRRSETARTQHLVLLHLSRQCNHPRLAHAAALRAVAKQGRVIRIHTAEPNAAGPVLKPKPGPVRQILGNACVPVMVQGYLPGWHEEVVAG